MKMSPPAVAPVLVAALDMPDLERAATLVDRLAPLGLLFKIGYEAYYRYGAQLEAILAARSAEYVLDLKLHDIPNTVHAAVRAVLRPGVRIVTAHALGGAAMLEAAVEAARERAAELRMPAPKIFAVTLLTSLGDTDLGELGLAGGLGENVIRLAALARDARCSGVVCSAREAADVKSYFGADFETLCPGIRPAGSTHGDQKRAVTPRQAAEAGVDYAVVGRPIVADADPVEAARAILAELRG